MSHTNRTINAILEHLGFAPQTKATLGSIAAVCRTEFLAALDACHHKGAEAEQADRDLLRNALCAVSPETQACLAAAELNLSSERLLQLAMERPLRFASAMDILRDSEHPKRSEALVFLASCQAPLPMPSSVPAEKAPADPPKQFRSEHVYGSNHALCWNAIAGKDGVPGIMLDAANSQGSGYDWGGRRICGSTSARSWRSTRCCGARCRSAISTGTARGTKSRSAWNIRSNGCTARVADGRTLYGVRIPPVDATRGCRDLLRANDSGVSEHAAGGTDGARSWHGARIAGRYCRLIVT
jgi:plasmid stability protein